MMQAGPLLQHILLAPLNNLMEEKVTIAKLSCAYLLDVAPAHERAAGRGAQARIKLSH